MILIQLFLPLADNEGMPFPRSLFSEIKNECAKKFGGVTSFSQSPAEGIWNKSDGVQKDLIIIYEVMANEIDKEWWSHLKYELEKRMKQDQVLIRWFEINML